MSRFRRHTRADTEAWQAERLSPAATLATAGRPHPEPLDDLRTPFERDRDRILHSKAFRRLKHKTQVFMNPAGDHYVTRLTHTLQVTQIGRAIARYLSLNESLTEAICLGHDVGHSPFGHTGEEALSEFVEGGWLHAHHSVRVLQDIECLNLTMEVVDGIAAHSWKIDPPPTTPEGMICRFADRIAYLTHDVEDALRAGVIGEDDLPASALDLFGPPGSAWIDHLIRAVVEGSLQQGRLTMDERTLGVMHDLREFMFERVYLRPAAAPQRTVAMQVVRDLVTWYRDHPAEFPFGSAAQPLQGAMDYVAGMTDRYAIAEHDRLFGPISDQEILTSRLT